MTLSRRLLTVAGRGGGIVVPPFDPSVTVNTTTTLGSGGSPDWWGRASIKRRDDGVLILVYRRGSKHEVNDGALHIKFNPTGAPGDWTAEDTKIGGGAVSGFPMNPSTLTGGQDAGEPWLMKAPNGDFLIHMWRVDYGVSVGGTWQTRSTDDGESWDTSALVAFGHPTDPDTQIFATDDDFVFEGVIYAGARIYNHGADGIPSESILVKSANNGTSWAYVSTIMSDAEGESGFEGGQEVGLEYIGNDTIIAMIRDNKHTRSYQRMSTNLGATWGTLTNVTSTVGIAARQRVYTLAHVRGEDEWWTDPYLIMVGFEHQDPGDADSLERRNAVWLSHNRGADWDGPHYLNATTDDGGYGDVFWRGGDAYTVVSYAGSLAAASLIQYDLTIDL
jgi:hypothetical protein